MQNEGVEKAEAYRSGGPAVGVIGLVLIAATIGYGLLDPESGFAPWGYALCLLLGVLVWMVLIRPAVRIHADEVELRNMAHTRWVPFALATSVEVGQVTVVYVGERRYVGSGFGRTRRTLLRDGKAPGDTPLQKRSAGWLIEDKLRRRIASARESSAPMGEVRRVWAWPEITAAVVLAVATLALAVF